MAFYKYDISCKDATVAASAQLSHVGPITRSKFKASGLDGSEYFASLEMAKKSRSHMTFATAIFGSNTPFSMFDKLSPTASNLGGFEDSVDSSVSTKVNALMTDATNVDEKFAMMEQTIEVLKKSVEDKDLQIAQLMNKLEAYAPGESSHVPPRSPVFTSQKTAVEESFAKLNIQKEKQSTSVAALSVQQLQDMITNTIRAQYGGPSQSSLELDNHSKDKDDEGWILVTHKKRKHQAVLRLPLPKPRAKISDVDRLQPPRIIKSSNSALSPKFRKPITLHEFFPGKLFHGSHVGATHVVSSTDKTTESNDEPAPMKTQENYDNGKVVTCCATISFTDDDLLLGRKIHLRFCEPKVEKPSSDDKADVKSEEENEAQWTTIKPPKKGTEEVSIKLSSSEGDIQTKTEEHLVFRYVPRECRKKGQPLLQECTLKKQMSHKDIQHLKEHMTVPVAQIPSVTCESAKGNPQADKIKGHYDPKAFILLEKSGYDFSNPSQLGELKDEVTGEKIHGLNESQIKLRKQGHYVATPKFGLGFSLVEPLRISSKRSKKIASSQYTSVEEMKEVKGNKIKQRASVFDRIGGSTPSDSVFERLSHKGGRVSSKHLKEVSTTSKTSVFCHLGTTRKLPSRKILSKHKEQVHEERDHFEVVADKEICSAFPSRMKRKSILSISTDGPLKVQRRIIVYTCQPRKEAKKEKEAMPTIQGSQREKFANHSPAKDEIWSLELQASFLPSRKAEMHHVLARMLQSGDMARRSSSLRNTLNVSRQAARRDVPSCCCTLFKTCKNKKRFWSPRCQQDDVFVDTVRVARRSARLMDIGAIARRFCFYRYDASSTMLRFGMMDIEADNAIFQINMGNIMKYSLIHHEE
ncbi:hypothetical protein A4A49_21469 [Nicotiana attenuata]|uniref:Uncharacterized protein n=1 Tax=Nicotiana attenuata TaxID=49451 RepID=A0A1J6KCS8_NICAT|nr:hypothetical protein A4A49_21469 [Nicotiana attenuata]